MCHVRSVTGIKKSSMRLAVVSSVSPAKPSGTSAPEGRRIRKLVRNPGEFLVSKTVQGLAGLRPGPRTYILFIEVCGAELVHRVPFSRISTVRTA
jgi:hypothetical protein